MPRATRRRPPSPSSTNNELLSPPSSEPISDQEKDDTTYKPRIRYSTKRGGVGSTNASKQTNQSTTTAPVTPTPNIGHTSANHAPPAPSTTINLRPRRKQQQQPPADDASTPDAQSKSGTTTGDVGAGEGSGPARRPRRGGRTPSSRCLSTIPMESMTPLTVPAPNDVTVRALGLPQSARLNGAVLTLDHEQLVRMREGHFYRSSPGRDSDADRNWDLLTLSEAAWTRLEEIGCVTKGRAWTAREGYDDHGEAVKPELPYVMLTKIVIASSPRKMLTLSQIYQAMEERWPFFKSLKQTFRNSIRHNLSMNPAFINVERPLAEGGLGATGKGGYWRVSEDPTNSHRGRVKKPRIESSSSHDQSTVRKGKGGRKLGRPPKRRAASPAGSRSPQFAPYGPPPPHPPPDFYHDRARSFDDPHGQQLAAEFFSSGRHPQQHMWYGPPPPLPPPEFYYEHQPGPSGFPLRPGFDQMMGYPPPPGSGGYYGPPPPEHYGLVPGSGGRYTAMREHPHQYHYSPVEEHGNGGGGPSQHGDDEAMPSALRSTNAVNDQVPAEVEAPAPPSADGEICESGEQVPDTAALQSVQAPAAQPSAAAGIKRKADALEDEQPEPEREAVSMAAPSIAVPMAFAAASAPGTEQPTAAPDATQQPQLPPQQFQQPLQQRPAAAAHPLNPGAHRRAPDSELPTEPYDLEATGQAAAVSARPIAGRSPAPPGPHTPASSGEPGAPLPDMSVSDSEATLIKANQN